MAYLLTGEEVEVVERITSGVVVRRYYGHGDSEGFLGEPEIVSEVFEVAPTERKAQEIAELERREQELIERISLLESQALNLTASERLRKWKNQKPALDRIDDILSGRITHYLLSTEWAELKIIDAVNGAIPNFDDERQRYPNGTRLLSLFGDSNGDLTWKINSYRDGSGNWTCAEPFTSREATLARAQEIVNGFETRKDRHYIYRSAVALGLTVPAGLSEWIGKDHIANAERSAEQALAVHNKATEALNAVRQKWGAAPNA